MIGFLSGAVVGAIVALLYAPKSGKELRRDIKEKAGDLKDEVAEKLRVAKTKAADIINEGKRRSDQIIYDAKEQASHLLDDADKLISTAKERAGEEAKKVNVAFRTGVDAYKKESN